MLRFVPLIAEEHSADVPLEHVITGAALGAMEKKIYFTTASYITRIY